MNPFLEKQPFFDIGKIKDQSKKAHPTPFYFDYFCTQ
jgi:hypothetical protein